jgi:CubicO group peptidase (beta-lactamase class C family)
LARVSNRQCKDAVLAAGLCFLAAGAARADRTDDYIAAQMQAQHIPGLAIAIIRDGRVVKLKGYGYANLEQNSPATADTVFETCSVTKQFTAAGILLLVKDGKLRLDDPISRYIDHTPASWSGVTIRQALTMTSGIPDYINDPLAPGAPSLDQTRAFPRTDTTADQIIQSVEGAPLKFTPGDQFSYSNTNYIILARIIEKVSGRSWDTYLTERIFKPLHMDRTQIDGDSKIIPGRAARYDITSTAPSQWRNSQYNNPSFFFQGGGGILSTAADMAKWDAALRRGDLLSSGLIALMRTPQPLKDGSKSLYGFGWNLDAYQGHSRMWHNGGGDGRSANFSRFDDGKLSVVVLANTEPRMDAIADNVFGPDLIANDLAGFYEPALAHPSIMLSARPIAAMAGQPVTITVTAENWSSVAPEGELTLDVRVAPFDGKAVINHQASPPLVFRTGKTRSVDFIWTPPTSGEYRLYLGAFDKGWTRLYAWKNAAATIDVR